MSKTDAAGGEVRGALCCKLRCDGGGTGPSGPAIEIRQPLANYRHLTLVSEVHTVVFFSPSIRPRCADNGRMVNKINVKE